MLRFGCEPGRREFHMTRFSGITSAGALACSEGGVRPSFGETAAFAPYDAAKTPLLRVDMWSIVVQKPDRR